MERCTEPGCHARIEDGQPRQYVRDHDGRVVAIYCLECADDDLVEQWKRAHGELPPALPAPTCELMGCTEGPFESLGRENQTRGERPWIGCAACLDESRRLHEAVYGRNDDLPEGNVS